MWLWRLRVVREELIHAKPGGQPSHIFSTQKNKGLSLQKGLIAIGLSRSGHL